MVEQYPNIVTSKVANRPENPFFVLDLLSSDPYNCDASNDYERKKKDEMIAIHKEIERVAMTGSLI